MTTTTEASSPLRLHAVVKTFARGRDVVRALDAVDVEIKAGKITGLLGPDGAGKTTLLRLAAGLLRPDSGMLTVLGRERGKDAGSLQQDIGYMPQRFGLYEDLSVQENLDLYSDLQGLDPGAARQRQEALLKLTALGPFGKRRAGDLSGGMKQKLGLACALLRAPQLLLLDEPTVGVDPIARRELWQIVDGLRRQGTTVLMSTSYFDEAERCDEILLLHAGKLLRQGPLASFTEPLRGRCFLVRNPSVRRRALREALQRRTGVADARITAAGIRVLSRNMQPPAAAPGEAWQSVDAGFEDAFVALLGEAEDRAAASEASIRGRVMAVPAEPAAVSAVEKDDVVVEVRDLHKCFGSFEAVKKCSFTVRRGEIFGLLGANGAGKTTTFRMLCGLLPATSGTLTVAGVDMRRATSAARARVGYVAQRFALYGNLSVDQNLVFFAAAYGLRGAVRRQKIEEARQAFQLTDYGKVNADGLPLGIKQRLALACALLHEPPILFLDEPTSGVDPLARREFWQRINALAAQGVTVLITTHFMDEAEYCDQLVLMSLGEILAKGSPADLRQQARTAEQPEPTMEEAFIRLIEEHERQIRRAS